MKKYGADRKSLNFLRVIIFILLVIIAIAMKYLLYRLELAYPDYFASEQNTVPEIVIWSLVALAAAIYILYIVMFLPVWYNSVKYFIGNGEIISSSGVFFKSTSYMRLDAVQYVTLISAPLSKYTGFSFIILSAHGGRMALLFLSAEDAEEISGFIGGEIKKRSAPAAGTEGEGKE